MKQIYSIPQYGDNSQDVLTLQIQLHDLFSANLLMDGIFGNQTLNTIKIVQKSNGLKDDGIVGQLTLSLLELELITELHTSGYAALSWEFKHPNRISWSNYVHEIITKLFDDNFSLCTDILLFRSDFNTLTKIQKFNIWSEIVCRICLHESNWNPLSRMLESTFSNLDSVTGLPVYSEGLMQLSYQDQTNYARYHLPCRFDWGSDKVLTPIDPQKTILDPYINLEMGINILALQIRLYNKIVVSDRKVYWAVLRANSKTLLAIIQAVQAFKLT